MWKGDHSFMPDTSPANILVMQSTATDIANKFTILGAFHFLRWLANRNGDVG